MTDVLIGSDTREEAALRAVEEVSALFGEPQTRWDIENGLAIPVQSVGMTHWSDWAFEFSDDIEPILNWYDIARRNIGSRAIEALPGVMFDPADWAVCADQEDIYVTPLAHYLDSDPAERFRATQPGNRVTVVQLSPTEVIVSNGHHRIARAMVRREPVADVVFVMTPDAEALRADPQTPMENWVAARLDGMTPGR